MLSFRRAVAVGDASDSLAVNWAQGSGAFLPVSKGGVRHRMRNVQQIADPPRREQLDLFHWATSPHSFLAKKNQKQDASTTKVIATREGRA
jgi:DNA polymerase IIIc chi subunit